MLSEQSCANRAYKNSIRKAIAKRLNADGVQSPQPQQGRISRSWCPSTIRTILPNERYLRKVVWSRKHKVRDPKSGRRVFRTREGETPIRGADRPELQIVPENLWLAVEDRRDLVKRIYEDAGKRSGLLRSSAMNAPYLLGPIEVLPVRSEPLDHLRARPKSPEPNLRLPAQLSPRRFSLSESRSREARCSRKGIARRTPGKGPSQGSRSLGARSVRRAAFEGTRQYRWRNGCDAGT